MRYLLSFVLAIGMVTAKAQARDLNSLVVTSAEFMEREKSQRGYDLRSAFTEDLLYGRDCCVKSTNQGQTMCVAAVAEVIIRALTEFDNGNTGSNAATKLLRIESWTKSTFLSIRPHIFQYKEAASNGPGDAFERFGIGENLQFSELKAGDFLAFSRFNGSGHSVVFMGYLTESGRTSMYTADVVGFEYFSAQNSTNGVGKRKAYFGSFQNKSCPRYATKGSDCGIIRNRFLNAGRLLEPNRWSINDAPTRLRELMSQTMRRSGATVDDAKLDKALTLEIAPVYGPDFLE